MLVLGSKCKCRLSFDRSPPLTSCCVARLLTGLYLSTAWGLGTPILRSNHKQRQEDHFLVSAVKRTGGKVRPQHATRNLSAILPAASRGTPPPLPHLSADGRSTLPFHCSHGVLRRAEHTAGLPTILQPDIIAYSSKGFGSPRGSLGGARL